MLNIKRMLVGKLHNMAYINRWNLMSRQRQESNAEHTFFVAFYTMLIVMSILEDEPTAGIRLDLALSKALIHDIEEAATGDLHRAYKKDLKSAAKACGAEGLVEGVESDYMSVIARDLFKEDRITEADRMMMLQLQENWKNAKDGVEGEIVAFADFLSAVQFAYRELLSGNIGFIQELPSFFETLIQFQGSEYIPLRKFSCQSELCEMIRVLDSKRREQPF